MVISVFRPPGSMRNILLQRTLRSKATHCCIRTSTSWIRAPVNECRASVLWTTSSWSSQFNDRLLRGITDIRPRQFQRASYYSTNSKSPDDKPQDESLSIFQRFKLVYKEYGKILIGVHVVTSIVWYGMFYAIAYSGIDLLPLIIKLGASEALQAKFVTAGDFLVAYILYELAKPVRYFITLVGTQQTVQLAKRRGYLPEVKPEDKLRSLAKESGEKIKTTLDEKREDLKERYHESRSELRDKWHKSKQRLRSRSRDRHRHKHGDGKHHTTRHHRKHD